jgi:2-keto-3-deoxy-6-phosphogluconate aldolase
METKKIIIGAASGLVANTIVQNALRDSWAAVGVRYSKEATALYDSLIKEGKTIDEATAILEKAQPLWKKLGSNRVNGLIAAGAGVLLTQVGNDTVKTAGAGMVIMGALKVLFPSRTYGIDFLWGK